MKYVMLSVIALALCACQADFMGAWENIEDENDVILIRQPDESDRSLWAVKTNARLWATYKKVNGTTYSGKRFLLERSGDELIVSDKHKKQEGPKTYRLLSPQSLPLQKWMTYDQMPKEFVHLHFPPPDTIVKSTAGAEKWFYPGDLALVFYDDKLIKVRENYRLLRNYSMVWPGMNKVAVLEVLGTPDRGREAESKWYYGLEAEVIFEEDLVKEIRLLDVALAIATAAAEREQTEVSIRDKALPFITKGAWYEQDAEVVDEFFKQNAAAGPGGAAAKVVGAFTRSKTPAISYPMLTMLVSYLRTTPPTTAELASAVGALELTMSDVRQNRLLREEVRAFTMEQPVFIEEKEMLLLKSKAQRKSGELVYSHQAIFIRGRKMYAIQLSFVDGQTNTGLEDFQRIIEEVKP